MRICGKGIPAVVVETLKIVSLSQFDSVRCEYARIATANSVTNYA